MAQFIEKRSVLPLYIKAELVPEKFNVVEICVACERVTGKGSIDGATLVNRLWRVLPFNEVSRAKLLSEGIKLAGSHIIFEGKNPFLHPSGEGETQTTKLIVKNLPFSYSQEAVERNLVSAGFKIRSKMQWMKGRNRTTGHLTDFRDGRRAVFIDLPTGQVSQTIQMGPFRARIEYVGMKTTCFRCMQEGHTARNCPNEEVCHTCKKPGHRKDQCPDLKQHSAYHKVKGHEDHSDIDSDSETDEKMPGQKPQSESREPPNYNGLPLPPRGKPTASTEKPMPRRRRRVTYAEAVKSAPVVDNPDTTPGEEEESNEVEMKETRGEEDSKKVGETVATVVVDKVDEPEGAVADIQVSKQSESKTESERECESGFGAGLDSQVPPRRLQETREGVDSPMTAFIKSVDFVALPNPKGGVAAESTAETPTKRGNDSQPDSSPPTSSAEVTTIWGDPIEKDDDLLIEASQIAESKESSGRNSQNEISKVSVKQKIKRAFAAIRSPPSEESKEKATSPLSQKRKTEN